MLYRRRELVPKDIIEFYRRHLQTEAPERYNPQRGFYQAYNGEKIREALAAAFEISVGVEYLHPDVITRACVLGGRLASNGSFEHDSNNVAFGVAVEYLTLNGYSYTEATKLPNETLKDYFIRTTVPPDQSE